MNRNIVRSLFIAGGFATVLLSACIKEDENPAEGTPGQQISLFSLRQLWQGGEVSLTSQNLGGASTIQGVVISDRNGKNIDDNSFVIQQTMASANSVTDVTRGITIRLDAPHSYSLGDSLQVDISGGRLGRSNGVLAISGITASKITSLATGRTPLVRAVTQGTLQTLMDQYESTLVSLHSDVADYASGPTLSGNRQLSDNSGFPVFLRTMANATFATNTIPQNAQFTGIAAYYKENAGDTSGAQKVILPRAAGDIAFASGTIHTNFPESFENPDASTKSSYNSGTNMVTLNSGSWTLLQAILGNTLGSDKINIPGKQAIRMQQNLTTSGFLQMNFDVPNASKVTVFYGRYGTDARSTFRLEMSTNGGTTWTAVGSNITDMPDKGMKQATWTVNATVPVRFRINKLGTGTSNNGRLNFDDFVVYKQP